MPLRGCPLLIVALSLVLTACGGAAQGGAGGAPVATQAGTAVAPTAPTATPAGSAVPLYTPAPTREIVSRIPPDSCPVTRPPDPPFVPPAPYPPTPPSFGQDQFWHGTAALWTALSADGTWRMAYRDGVHFDKSFWWRQGYNNATEQQPALALTGRRLDTTAPPAESPGPATNGSRGDMGSFMLTMLELPSPGCWEITGRYGTAETRFVVWVVA